MPRPDWTRQIPNALTLARVGLAASCFAAMSAWDGSAALPLWLACGFFVAAALTDALDGNLARRWNVVSLFGRVMDPFADKLLILGSFVLLASPIFSVNGAQASGVAPWMAVVILARELLVTSMRAAFETRGVDFSATLSGKLKMIVQSLAVPAILIVVATNSDARTAAWIAWITVVVTVASGIPYITRALRLPAPAKEARS